MSGGARTTTFELRPLGPVRVETDSLRPAGARPVEDPMFDLSLSGLRGRITVDAHLALRAVAATLGAPPPRLLRPLQPLERGVLASLIVSGLRALEVAASIHASPPAGGLDAALAIEIPIAAMGTRATVRLDVPRALLPPPFSEARADREGRLAVETVVELGRTDLPAADVDAARAGDAIVFGPPGAVSVRVGALRAAAEIRADGVLLAGPFAADPAAGGGAGGETQILPASWVEIAAEAGRLVFHGADVLRLVPGAMLPIESATPVELRARGRRWAHGERADLDGKLAVRIMAVYR